MNHKSILNEIKFLKKFQLAKDNLHSYQNLELEIIILVTFQIKNSCHIYLKQALINPEFRKKLIAKVKDKFKKFKITVNRR